MIILDCIENGLLRKNLGGLSSFCNNYYILGVKEWKVLFNYAQSFLARLHGLLTHLLPSSIPSFHFQDVVLFSSRAALCVCAINERTKDEKRSQGPNFSSEASIFNKPPAQVATSFQLQSSMTKGRRRRSKKRRNFIRIHF